MAFIEKISITCFLASYAVALALEISRLYFRSGVRGAVMLGFGVAGLVAHTLFLAHRALESATPLASEFDFYLVAAWVLAVMYLYLTVYHPHNPIGLFVLPVVLLFVIGAKLLADPTPFPKTTASLWWGMAHGVFLLLGTVAVTVGFVFGLMYLLQAYRLKRKLPPAGLRLPSLEWLQRMNTRTIAVAVLTLGCGFLAGIVLNRINRNANGAALPWTDPVVLSSSILVGWMVVAWLFNHLYKPAQQGRKVAYLTVASFVFLVIALVAMLTPTKHGKQVRNAECGVRSVVASFPHSALRTSRLRGRPTMKVQMVGCSHHRSSDEVRGRLAFSPAQAGQALEGFRARFPGAEAVLLSTCNRVEVYTAAEDIERGPTHQQVVEFLAGFHGLEPNEVLDDLFERTGEDAVLHLFTVAASLDSMVVGESQILSQVKQAYDLARERDSTGPVTHAMFQAALRVAKRVASETSINQKRVSIPSVAVCDFASQIFERFDDKRVLVVGAGEMADETLRYLVDEGARDITIVNRRLQRAEELAQRWQGRAAPWERLPEMIVAADLVVSTTGATEPIVTLEAYRRLEPHRYQRPLFVLDLAMPRDFEPAIGGCLNVYLYSIDDLRQACDRNLQERQREFPAALAIIEQETAQFMTDLHHRTTGPIIQRLKLGWHKPKEDELRRLFNKLPELDERSREEIGQAFDRLINKLLHPPLESLRDEARIGGAPHTLLEALKRLFQLKD